MKRVIVIAVAAVAAVAPAPAAAEDAPVTITGTFTYDDASPGPGVAGRGPQPIAFARVDVWSCAPGFLGLCAWGKVAQGQTGGTGFVSVSVPWNGVPGTEYAVRVYAENDAAVVWPLNGGVEPFWVEPGAPDGWFKEIRRTANAPGESRDFSYAFARLAESKYFNLAETARRARAYVASRRDPTDTDPFPRVNITPVQPAIPATFYDPPLDEIRIDADNAFDDRLIVHEYGHFVEEQLASMPWAPSSHSGCAIVGVGGSYEEIAFMEAYADYLAAAVAHADGTLLGTGSGTPSNGILESPPWCGMPQDEREHRIAGVLWDLLDEPWYAGSTSEFWDVVSGHDGSLLRLLDGDLEDGANPTFSKFRAAWRARGFGGLEFDVILWRLGFAVDYQFSLVEPWLTKPFVGAHGNTFADVNGDGMADAIAVQDTCIEVAIAHGTGFYAPQCWALGKAAGETHFTDVNGDGKADAILVDGTSIVVKHSNGSDFNGDETTLSTRAYAGSSFADVTGDGKADSVRVDEDGIFVAVAAEKEFAVEALWAPYEYSTVFGRYFADVDGNGTADMIEVDANGIVVRLSFGSYFGPPQAWTKAPFYGKYGTYFADVNGDSLADAIAVDDGTIRVALSDTHFFVSEAQWSHEHFVGEVETAVADVTGDNRADAIVVHFSGIDVRRAIG